MAFNCVPARLFYIAVSLLIAAVPALAGEDWKPIDPSNLAAKTPVVEKDADAEAIFWEVHINDAGQDLVFSHYIRIKVFTERGKESQSKIDIPYYGRNQIIDVAGRTIKQDGTVVELKKDAVFDRTIAKASGIKIKAKSFAMPSVEPGVIIEYRWKEIRPYTSANNIRLQFQREIPVQSVKYFIKPATLGLSYAGSSMMSHTFNGDPGGFTRDTDGFYSTSLTNVPAFHEEPRMPPEDQVRTWMLVYYAYEKLTPPALYWPKQGKEYYEYTKGLMKVNEDVRKAAAEAIGNATAPEEKLHRLFDFCRARVKNVNDDAYGITDTERAKVKKNESPSDTLKHGMGTAGDMNNLFGALAIAAGFDARFAMIGDRSDMFFDRNFTNPYFLKYVNIAVKLGTNWKFFEPSMMYVPFGMLRWQEEGMPALVCDPKDSGFVTIPLSPSEKSMLKKTGTLKLSEDGTLEGEVRLEYTGQLASEMKERNDGLSPAQREERIRDSLKERLSTAETSNMKIENVTDPNKPFTYSYHVRVPGYAQRTGKRLFVQPAYFEKGNASLFSASSRTHPIYFHYPWKEEDSITIDLPAGFALDNADAPSPFHSDGVADYKVRIAVIGKNEALQYDRTFTFIGLMFPPSSYPELKRLFDALHENDNHTITLKQVTASQ